MMLCWSMPPVSVAHCIRAAAAALAIASPWAAAAQGALVDAGQSNLTIFLRNVPIGSEQVTVTRTADGWTIASSGRIGPPIDAVARRIEVRYTGDWRVRDFRLEGTARGVSQTVHTVFEGTQARSDVETGGQATQKTDTIDANAVAVLPNTFFGPFEAVAARLRNTAAGSDIPVYGVPAVSFTIRVGEGSTQQIQTAARTINARRTPVKMILPGAEIDADMWTDENSRMIRLSVPAQSLEVVREDVASVASRSITISRPNDESVKIPANGFVLAGTLSRPAQAGATRLPAVVLVGGSGPTDRDGLAFGIPILGQIADAVADAGFVVLRYDKRGIGQSGGRAESAGLVDYAEDARAAVKFLSGRKDVDPRRIALVGHSEGGAVALIAAAKDKRIAAVGLLAATGVTGAELILAQQRRLLDRTKLSVEEKQAKIELQKRIHEAVLTGKGWDAIPADVRRTVDNPEFQSILTNDPAKIMPDVKQPLLVVQGELDTQVEPPNAERLAALARQRKNARPVDLVKAAGVNHLLVPAATGEVDEYGRLANTHVSPAVIEAIVTWLKKTL